MCMDKKTLRALNWIVSILEAHKIPYRVGGGFAAHMYGSLRPVKDIDISLSGKYFRVIMPEVKEYITSELQHYSDEKWDCNTFSLDYEGQEIDITDLDTLRMSNKEETQWFQTKNFYKKFPNRVVDIGGISISLIDPRDLVAYKKELNGEHQLEDIKSIEYYIQKHELT
jgi:hypothetical protein